MHLGLAAPALAVLDLLVREHRAAGIAPIHGCLFLVGEAFLIEQLEQPLRPAVVVLTAGDDLAVPVVGKPQRTLLFLHVRDVRVRPLRRVHLVLDRCILGGHAEGVKPHRMQDVVPLHRAEARNHIADRVVADMPHVKFSRRIRKHLKRIVLRFRRIHLRVAAVLRLPDLLPLCFNLLRTISLHSARAPPKIKYYRFTVYYTSWGRKASMFIDFMTNL